MMKLIEKLSAMVDEEIEDAYKYAKCALNQKESRPSLADVLYRISDEEMRHMNLLHNQIVEIIEEYRRENGEPPEAMTAVYEFLHERQITKAAEVRALQGMYK